MKKTSKSFHKVLCVLLSLLLITGAGFFCVSVTASGTATDGGEMDLSVPEVLSGEEESSAQLDEPVSEEPSSEEPSSGEPSSEEPHTEPPTEPSDGAVAEIYHCVSGISLTYIFGHTWICIRNISSGTLCVGDRAIEPGQMIAAGLHRGGMKFDLEMRQYASKSVSAVKARINADQFAAAANEIMSSEWSYLELFGHNCTNFSVAVWKAATGQRMVPFIFPFVLKAQINARSPVSLRIE